MASNRNRKPKVEKQVFSPGTLKHRASPSSRYPVSLLSPASVRHRYGRLRQLYQNEAAKVKRLKEKLDEDLTVTLDSDQSKELADFLSENVTTEDVEKLLVDESTGEDAETKRAAILKAFQEDQAKNRTGQRGNRWNMVTYRIALSIFTRSPRTYREIEKWGIFQLPSISSLRQYTTAYLQDEGPYYVYIEEQATKYSKIQEQQKESGVKFPPNNEGVLILDEVKVAGKVIWNSKSGKISGLAMDKEKFSSLADIFESLSEKSQSAGKRDPAQYVLQFLWRDLSSKFDVIGPHYSSATTMTCSFTTACLWDAMHAFQMFGFLVTAVVMDGASSNLAMVKLLSGFGKGPYGLSGPPEDIHAVEPWFMNPEFTSRRIYLVMCPTHQLKNMINALWSSHEGRPKALQYGQGKKVFGWKQIEGMWQREKERRPTSIRMVKNLVKSYIDRDSWTKLNVQPAKIMQQPQVLAELYSHCNPDEGDPPNDQEETMATYDYLKACSLLFELGFLRTGYEGRIYNLESPTLQNILKGYEFFKSWMNQLREDFEDFSLTSTKERRFLAWQTYDLLRLAVYSFKELCHDYLERHPGYYIPPLKLNGSAVETLFSQFKASAGGKLTSVNYAHAKRSKQLQREVRGDDGGYRDAPLHTQFEPLRKKARKS